MAQLYNRRTSRAFRAGVLILPILIGAVAAGLYLYVRSDQAWNTGVAAPQPIPFRHDVHAGSLGLDCRYCHGSVEASASAGMPSAQTCMTCHSQVWSRVATLEPLRTSLALGVPLEWTSVHKLPDHTFFHHGIHLSKGVACETCHGRVDQMSETVKTETLSMGWCLECHRDPGPKLSEPEAIFSMRETTQETTAMPEAMLELHKVLVDNLTDCSTCHR